MNLTSQIILKDLRALRGPLAAWTAGLLVLAVEWSTRHPGERLRDSPRAVLFVVVLAGLSVALVAGIVHEDNLVTPNAFWRTRPIGRVRLLAAKIPLLLMVFVPAVVPLFVASAGSGVSLTKQVVLATCVMPVVAVVAALSRHLVQFLIGLMLTFGAFACFLLMTMEYARVSRIYQPRWNPDQFDSALGITGVGCAIALGYLYLGGARRVGIGLLAAALVLGPSLSLI